MSVPFSFQNPLTFSHWCVLWLVFLVRDALLLLVTRQYEKFQDLWCELRLTEQRTTSQFIGAVAAVVSAIASASQVHAASVVTREFSRRARLGPRYVSMVTDTALLVTVVVVYSHWQQNSCHKHRLLEKTSMWTKQNDLWNFVTQISKLAARSFLVSSVHPGVWSGGPRLKNCTLHLFIRSRLPILIWYFLSTNNDKMLKEKNLFVSPWAFTVCPGSRHFSSKTPADFMNSLSMSFPFLNENGKSKKRFLNSAQETFYSGWVN